MTPGSGELAPRELDPLATSSAGTALAGVASLVWPELVSAVVSLAALTGFVIWIRALRALKHRRSTGYRPGRLAPLVLVGVVGWSIALFVGPIFPLGRPLALGGASVGLWALARPALGGV